MRTLIEKQNPDEILPDHTLYESNLQLLQKLINSNHIKYLKSLISLMIWLNYTIDKQYDEYHRMLYITETYLNDIIKIEQLAIDEAKESGVCGQQNIEFEYKCFLVNAIVNYYPEDEPQKDWNFSVMHCEVKEILKLELIILNP